jgi:16S rRNA processing protein RimM
LTPTAEVTEPAESQPLVVGRIGRPHGLRGEVSVVVRTDAPDQRFSIGSVFRLSAGRRLTVAEALRGMLLTVTTDELPPSDDPDEFHDHQLVGLRAELADGQLVGAVSDVLHGPAGELLVLSRDGLADALVPFVRAIVPTVDLPGGRVVLTPPDGLLEE